VEKVGTGPRLQFRTFKLKNLPRMEKNLECGQAAAVAVASAKKNVPNAKFPWYGKREDLQNFVKKTRSNKGYSRMTIYRHVQK
jgi:hypothetical protein